MAALPESRWRAVVRALRPAAVGSGVLCTGFVLAVVSLGSSLADGRLDTDGDEIGDDYETLFGLNLTDPSGAFLDLDSDTLVNLDEAALWTDPLQRDTDRDGWHDGLDETPISRAFLGFDGQFIHGDDYLYPMPAWVDSVHKAGGSWTNGAWYVPAASPSGSALLIDLAPSEATSNLTLEIEITGQNGSTLFVDLLDAAGVPLAGDVAGNLAAGGAQKVRRVYTIPIETYRTARTIRLRHARGAVWVHEILIYVDRDGDALDTEQEEQLGASDADDCATNRPKIVLDLASVWPVPYSPAVDTLRLFGEYRILPTDAMNAASGQFYVRQDLDVLDPAGTTVYSSANDSVIDPSGIWNASRYMHVSMENDWAGTNALGLAAADGTYGYRIRGTYLRVKNGTKLIAASGMLAGEFLVDSTPPLTSAMMTPPPNENGWHKNNVMISLSAVDNLSGIAAIWHSIDGGVALEGTKVVVDVEGLHTIAYWGVDLAGNSEEPKNIAVRIDKTKPALSVAGRTPPNLQGWNNTAVTIDYSVSDSRSGIATNLGGYETDVVMSQGIDQAVSASATDMAGNFSSIVVGGINIDLTPPLILSLVPGAIVSTNPFQPIAVVYGDDLAGINPASVVLTVSGVDVTPQSSVTATSVFYSAVTPFAEGDVTLDVVLDDTAGNATTTSATFSVDSDGLPNAWEMQYVGNLNEVGTGDPDGDELSNLLEYQLGTDPAKADTDGDGYADGVEVAAGSDPLDPQSVPVAALREISGNIRYSGGQAGTIWVIASSDSNLSAVAGSVALSSPGPYVLTNLTGSGEYWVWAYRDSNGNRNEDSPEACGTCLQNPVRAIDDTTNVNITLTDPDNDADGAPDWWELARFGNLDRSGFVIVTVGGPLTIQDAIDVAVPGGCVVLFPGIYTGAGNKDLDFGGKNITLRSSFSQTNTIIDCENAGNGFEFHSGENTESVVEGLTIRNGNWGMRCEYAGPTIRDCEIRRNSGGIYCLESAALIRNCTIADNKGSGIKCDIVGEWYEGPAPAIENCTIVGNGSGIGAWSAPSIVNSIVWSNSGGQIAAAEWMRYPTVAHCCVEGGWAFAGEGNTSADPLLVPGSYRLKADSPCIDAGVSNGIVVDREGESRWDDPAHSNAVSIWDIGADEFVDRDHDQMADAWEIGRFGGLEQKADGDANSNGWSNLAEYEYGTVPPQDATHLRMEHMGWGWMTFVWNASVTPATAGYKYQVEKRLTREGEAIARSGLVDIGNVTRLTLTNEPGYYYTVTIHAYDAVGNMTESPLVTKGQNIGGIVDAGPVWDQEDQAAWAWSAYPTADHAEYGLHEETVTVSRGEKELLFLSSAEDRIGGVTTDGQPNHPFDDQLYMKTGDSDWMLVAWDQWQDIVDITPFTGGGAGDLTFQARDFRILRYPGNSWFIGPEYCVSDLYVVKAIPAVEIVAASLRWDGQGVNIETHLTPACVSGLFTLEIMDGDNVVRTLDSRVVVGGAYMYQWDGNDNQRNPVPATADYSVRAQWTTGAGTVTVSDSKGPVRIMRAQLDTSQTDGAVAWNGGSGGRVACNLEGQGSGTLTLLISGTDGPVRTVVAEGCSAGLQTVVWDAKGDDGLPVVPGRYTVSCVWETAGGRVSAGSVQMFVVRAQFDVAKSDRYIDLNKLASGNQAKFVTRLDPALEEYYTGLWGPFTLKIMDEAGNVKRTVASAYRGPMVFPMPPMFPGDPGTWLVLNEFTDLWDGKDDAGNPVPPGVYKAYLEWTVAGVTCEDEMSLILYEVKYVRLWDAHRPANRTTRAINAAERQSQTYEDNPRSDWDGHPDIAKLLFGGWGDEWSGEVRLHCEFQPSIVGSRVLWEIDRVLGEHMVGGSQDKGDFALENTATLNFVPAGGLRLDHGEKDLTIYVGVDLNGDAKLQSNERFIPKWEVFFIGRNEYNYAREQLPAWLASLGSAMSIAVNMMAIFLDADFLGGYSDVEPSVPLMFDDPSYRMKDGQGCDAHTVTEGSTRRYTWGGGTIVRDRVLLSQCFWEKVIRPTLEGMNIGDWYDRNPSQASMTFTGRFHKSGVTFPLTTLIDADLNLAFGGTSYDVVLSVVTERGTSAPTISGITVTGGLDDLYDFETNGGDDAFGWASRVQICYSPGTGRTAGKIFRQKVVLDSHGDMRDDYGRATVFDNYQLLKGMWWQSIME